MLFDNAARGGRHRITPISVECECLFLLIMGLFLLANLITKQMWCLILLVMASPCANTVLEQQIAVQYHSIVRLIHQFSYAMDPEQPDDRSLIDDTPTLYTMELRKYSDYFKDSVMKDDVICELILGVFKNYANIIKDRLGTAAEDQPPYISKSWVESYAVWSTSLLTVTLEGKYYDLTSITCHNQSPLELSCSLMLHKVMSMLLVTTANVEQLYTCLVLLTANSDMEGFDMIWKKYCKQKDCSDPCEVFRRSLLTGAASWRNISLLDIAMFHCEVSNVCSMLDHVILPLCPSATHNTTHMISTWLSHVSTPQQCTSCGLMDVILHGCHSGQGWRKGFLLEDDHCQLPSLYVEELSVEVLQLFAAIGQPLVIKGVGRDWRLLAKWRRHHLEKYYGTVEVLGGSIPYGEIFRKPFGMVTVEEFLTYMDKTHTDLLPVGYYNSPIRELTRVAVPFYVFDVEVLHHHFSEDYTVPDVFRVWNATEHHQFILGPPGSGAPFHFHCDAINFLAYGRKKWLMLPPGEAVYSKLHPLQIYSSRHVDVLSDLKPLECVQHAGEMLYVPSHWAHATINLDESIGLAVEFEQPTC